MVDRGFGEMVLGLTPARTPTSIAAAQIGTTVSLRFTSDWNMAGRQLHVNQRIEVDPAERQDSFVSIEQCGMYGFQVFQHKNSALIGIPPEILA